jgi:hypothetical protein
MKKNCGFTGKLVLSLDSSLKGNPFLTALKLRVIMLRLQVIRSGGNLPYSIAA